MQESDDTYVITDGRKPTSRVFFPSEEEGNLRYRYSSSSSSSSSITPKCFNQAMSSMTSTPFTKDTNLQGFSPSTGIVPDYGSFQPTSYTEAYVPPLSLRRNLMTDFANHKLEESSIRIDSGYNDGCKSSPSSTLPSVNRSLRPGSTSSWWDSVFSVSMQNFRQRWNGNDRPRFVDEGQRRRWKIKPQQVVASFILVLVICGIGFFLWISNNNFKFSKSAESKNNSVDINIKTAQAEDLESASKKFHVEGKDDQIGNVVMKSSFLLPENSTREHVEMLKNQMEAKFEAEYNSELSDKVNETAQGDINKINDKGKGKSTSRN